MKNAVTQFTWSSAACLRFKASISMVETSSPCRIIGLNGKLKYQAKLKESL
jgi:hypothetical protein